MMKKGLIALLLALPLALTACLDGDSATDAMQPGYNIYNVANLQKYLALIPADAGIRLAMLLAEADKQGLTENRLDVQVDNTALQPLLFSSDVTISQEGTQYRVEYTKNESSYSGYSYGGTIVVETAGRAISDTDVDNAWTISATGFKVYYGGALAYEYVEVPVRIYREGSAYEIVVESRVRYASGAGLTSNCSGSFSFAATDASLAYSACHIDNADYKLNGRLEGPSFASLNTQGTATEVEYEAVNLRYKLQNGSVQVFSGTEKCSLPGIFDYDRTYYISNSVEVVYTNGQGIMTYNGQQR